MKEGIKSSTYLQRLLRCPGPLHRLTNSLHVPHGHGVSSWDHGNKLFEQHIMRVPTSCTWVSGSLPGTEGKPTSAATSLKAERHLSAAIRLSISFFCSVRGWSGHDMGWSGVFR